MRISVIVPMFNSEIFIEECVNSILTQTFTDFELILVDDCSTDHTLEIVSNYTDPRIKIIRTIHNGKDWNARNLGLQIARGEYVYFVDHDDMLLPNALEILWHGVELSGADTIHFNHYFADSNPVGSHSQKDPVYRIDDTAPPWQFVPEDVEWRLFQKEIVISVMAWQKLIRRAFLFEHGIYFPPIWISSDALLFFAELCLARKIFIVDGAGYIYRNNLRSQFHDNAEIKLRYSARNLRTIIQYMEEIFSKDLVTPLPRELQLKYENKIVTDSCMKLATRSYVTGIPIEKITSILEEEIHNGFMLDNESIRMLFHLGIESYLNRKSKS